MTIKELVEQRLAKNKEVQELMKKEQRTADENAKVDGLLTEINASAQEIDRRRAADAADAELRKLQDKPEDQPGDLKDKDKDKNKRSAAEQREFEARAFYNFCIKPNRLTAEERSLFEKRDETTTLGAGGELIPPYFQRDLEVAMKAYAPFTEYAQIIETPDGAPMTWPVSNDTESECEFVDEGEELTPTDVATDKVTFKAFRCGSLVKVSVEISQDSFTSVDSLVTDAFALRFGRGLSKKFTTGAGTTEPTGIVTAATAGPEVTGDDNADSPDPLTEVGYFDLLALLHSIDPAYRNLPQSKWMFTDNTLLALQKLKDKFGHPLWQMGLTDDAPDSILRKPYVVNSFMDNIGASKKPVLFGDLGRYKVRRVKNMTIQRLVERFATSGHIGLLAWARYDGNLVDAGMHPVKYLHCPAS